MNKIVRISSVLTALFFFVTVNALPVKKIVKFSPITFAIGCDSGTLGTLSSHLKRAPKAAPGVLTSECVDKSRQVENVRPESIALGENDAIGTFFVIITLKESDARQLADISHGMSPRRLVLAVKDEAVVAGPLADTFSGNRFFISADTEAESRSIADLFDE